jgi:hypothetical protein
MIIAERISVPFDSFPEIVLANARNGDPNAEIVMKEKRTVNGTEVWFVKLRAEIHKIPLVYDDYLYGGDAGSVQVITYSAESMAAECEKDFLEFLNGLWVTK